jgi:DNA-binding beta-propeller fold protein YncE
MKQVLALIVATVIILGCHPRPLKAGQDPGLVTLVQRISLDEIVGRIDHLGLDAVHERLFVAALGNNSVEVVDLSTGKVRQHLRNLRAPQGVGFAPESNRLAVANAEDGSLRLFDGSSLEQTAIIDLKDDADNVRYDASSGRFWVGYGAGGLAAIDPSSARQVADVKLDAHPESFQLETKGKRIFVNVPNAGYITVVDRKTASVIQRFMLTAARSNFPMALDEADHRLMVGCRNPAKLLILDTETFSTVATLDIVGDTDDVFYDSANKRIYVSGGEGYVTVIKQTSANDYEVTGQIATAPGARTSFFAPQAGRLYVAVPRRGPQKPELEVLTVTPKQ